MQKVSCVILNFNGLENTIECLRTVLLNKSEKFELEVIVVDNASRDLSVEKIRQKFPKVILLETAENLGFTGGCNIGMRYALKNGADYIMLLNNDTTVDKHLVENLLNPFVRGTRSTLDTLDTPDTLTLGATVPKIYFEKGFEFHKTKYKTSELGKVIWYAGGKMEWDNLIGENIGVDEVDHGQFDVNKLVELATGCCIMLSKKALNKTGFFDDRYFLYYEDADLSQRLKNNNFKILYSHKAFLWHKNAESSGVGSSLHDYYISRNRLLFGMNYAPLRTKIALIKESGKLLTSGRKWQKKGVRDFYLQKFGRGSFKI